MRPNPAPGIDAAREDIIYLMARVKLLHPKTNWFIFQRQT
jgi:hypothetical protein